MNILPVLLIVLMVIIILLFAIDMKVKAVYGSGDSKRVLILSWLYPLFKAAVSYESNVPIMEVYLFNLSIYKKVLKAGKHKVNLREFNKMKLLRNAELKDIDVRVSYGFPDPSVTGMAYGVLGIISQFVNVDSLSQKADFFADEDYVEIFATANLNIGLTLVNLIKINKEEEIWNKA